MSRSNFQNPMEGHRVDAPSNRDLEQRLTYQQLLNLNHDLKKQNTQLKEIGNRMGSQLKNLHNQFDIRPINPNTELYNSIASHPILHQYEQILTPLFDTYDSKIQQFENGFEVINVEFMSLEKKYEELAEDNEKLRVELADRIKELTELYKNGNPQKLGADFSQLILQQINQKQKYLIEQNARLAKAYDKYQSQLAKSSSELEHYKTRDQQNSSRIKSYELSQKKLQKQLAALKEEIFEIQIKNNKLQSQNKKIQNDLQRASSQLSQLNKDRDALSANYDNLKISYEKDVNLTQDYQDSRTSDRYRNSQLQDTLKPPLDDSYKKLSKLQKQFDAILTERNRLKQDLQQSQILLKQNNQAILQIKKQKVQLQKQIRDLKLSDQKSKKKYAQLEDKTKNQLRAFKKNHENQKANIEENFEARLQQKQKRIRQVQSLLEEEKLKTNQLQEFKVINALNKDNKGREKDNDRVADKLKEKLAINQELFNEQLQIVTNENSYFKNQNQKYKAELKDKNEQLRKLRQELQKVTKDFHNLQEEKSFLIVEIKRVRNDCEVELKQKQLDFNRKIQEVKQMVQQSDKKRKLQKQQISEASRNHDKLLEKIRNAYEQKIQALQNQNTSLKRARN